jgi:hypothetical protein
MYTKDLERLARSLVAQKLDREYIVYYLVETYQIEIKTAEEVLQKVAPLKVARGTRGQDPEALPPIKRQRFY